MAGISCSEQPGPLRLIPGHGEVTAKIAVAATRTAGISGTFAALSRPDLWKGRRTMLAQKLQ